MEDKDKKRDPMPPPDATPEEIGEFWDTHSLADYWDETHEVEFQVNLKSRQNLQPDEAEAVEQGWQKLKELVQSVKPVDFEKLVATLLTSFLKVRFVVAISGDQPRGDARNLTDEASIQVKNYSEGNKPRDIEIVRDINIVKRHLQDPQVYVLVISRDISEQSLGELETVSEETGLDIVTLELSDELSDLGALCVTYWEDIHHFFNLSDIDPQFSVWVQITRDDSKTQAQMEKVQSKLEDRIHTQSHVQKSTE
ncbi:MAG: hypothetical protein OYL97_14870 [Candidatus Poribacteria bacterium]|nr:hypothetical protein [Candidatus Poribacteria bacterium]